MSRQLVETKLENGWTISLVDQHGHLSARHNIDSYAAPVDLSGYEPVKRMQTGDSGYGLFARDGDTFAARYEPLPNTVGVFWWSSLPPPHRGVMLVERRIWLLGFAFLVVGVAVSAFMGSLYNQMETGNRFMNLSIDMFCTAGFDGYFKSLNPSWETALGFTTSELMAKPYLEFIHPDDRPATVAEDLRLQNREVTFAFENRYLCKDGSYKWMLWNAVSVPEQKLIYAVARKSPSANVPSTPSRESEKTCRPLSIELRFRGHSRRSGNNCSNQPPDREAFWLRAIRIVGRTSRKTHAQTSTRRALRASRRLLRRAAKPHLGAGLELHARAKTAPNFPSKSV